MPDYDSPFFITNDRADIDQVKVEDGTAVVWPLSDDAKLRRSPERQYCGNYVTYGDKGAATYRHNADTHDLIAAGPNQHRDMTSSFPMVKTKAKAQARGDRQLLDVQEQDVRITTRLVDIPATRVTLAKPGMRLQVKGTHWWPSCDTWHYARIVTAQPQPHSDGSLYDIDLELVLGDEAVGPPAPDYAGAVFAGLQNSASDDHAGGGNGLLQWSGAYPAALASPGWSTIETTGPIEIIESSAPFHSIRVLEPMVLRIHCSAQFSQVYFPDKTVSMSVTVNGVVVGTDSVVASGFFAGWLIVDLRDYHLDAGDVVTTSATDPEHWGNSGINDTFLQVGRGTFYDPIGGTLVFEGP